MTSLTKTQIEQIAQESEAATIAAAIASRMFKKDVWYEIDTADLEGDAAEKFAVYTEANDLMQLARLDMETSLGILVDPRLPPNTDARFAYRFGKVSVSPVTPTSKSAKSGGKIKL